MDILLVYQSNDKQYLITEFPFIFISNAMYGFKICFI